MGMVIKDNLDYDLCHEELLLIKFKRAQQTSSTNCETRNLIRISFFF